MLPIGGALVSWGWEKKRYKQGWSWAARGPGPAEGSVIPDWHQVSFLWVHSGLGVFKLELTLSSPLPRFLHRSPMDTSDNSLTELHPVHCRMFTSAPGFYPLDARSTPHPLVTAKNVCRHCQCPPRGTVWRTLPLSPSLCTSQIGKLRPVGQGLPSVPQCLRAAHPLPWVFM